MIRGVSVSFFFWAVLWSFTGRTNGWYLPGSLPAEFKEGEPVTLKVGSLRSTKTQVPLRFHDFAFCQPKEMESQPENIGEVLSGERIEKSAYKLQMQVEMKCEKLCTLPIERRHREKLMSAIEDEYTISLMADNLPAAMPIVLTSADDPEYHQDSYIVGFPMGRKIDAAADKANSNASFELFNHISILLSYHNPKIRATGQDPERNSTSDPSSTFRIVGFEVMPKSINHKTDNSGAISCESAEPQLISSREPSELTFTYDVTWRSSPIRWATRWDAYFQAAKGVKEIHWFAIINSLMVVLFLTAIVGIILLRTLLRDIARYNQLDNLEEAQEESGWKLLHGDVFRKPVWSRLLSVCAGTGIQIFLMTVLTMIFAVLGLLSPANRGALVQAMLLLFCFMGIFAGYVAARFSKLFENSQNASVGGIFVPTTKAQSIQVTIMTAFLYPGVCFAIFFIINSLLWFQKSAGAVPFGTMFLLLVLWFGISVPLVFVGSHFGLKRKAIEIPVRSNPIPREIPPHGCFTNKYVMVLVGGVLPFGAVFTELLFVLSSLWQHQIYYFFGFLAVVLFILIITCAEISISFVYFQLAAEDYHWWWRSFWCSASSAGYVFLYSLVYFFTRLDIHKFVSVTLFFGYTLILSYTFCLLTGAIGFLSTFTFMRAIYGSIKID